MERYERQILLEEINHEGQQKLEHARVLIVGAGGLGSPIALYLAAAGVGHIGLVDDDKVNISNLQRQIIYTESELGAYKSMAAASRLHKLNSRIKVEPIVCRLNETNAEDIIGRYDVIVDGCDNFETRYTLDTVCHQLGKPYVYGAVQGFEGQVSVFDKAHHTLRYRDLYPEPFHNVSKAIVGMTAGVVGCVQAHEVMKIVCGYGEVLYNRLWITDLRTMQSNIIEL